MPSRKARLRQARAAALIFGVVAWSPVSADEHARGWLCVAEKATGFTYRKSDHSWAVAEFATTNKFIIREPTADDLDSLRKLNEFSGGMGLDNPSSPPSYLALYLGISGIQPSTTMVCQDGPNPAGILSCGANPLWGVLNVNVHTLAMQHYVGSGGYLTPGQFLSMGAEPDTPYVEIGRCSPL